MRRTLGLLVPVTMAALVCGCAATVKSGPGNTSSVRVPLESSTKVVLNVSGPQAGDWEAFKGEWRDAFRRQAAAVGVAFDVQDGSPRPTGEPGTLLAVLVSDYRYLSAGIRYGFGVMTGNAYVESRIAFKDLATGQSFGEKTYNTSSSAWEGVFSAMTSKQLEAIAAAVLGDVKKAAIGAVPEPVAERVQPLPEPTSPQGVQAVVVAPTGRDERQAERLAEVQACHRQPRALLAAKGPGFETYTIACSNGDALKVRCEFGSCQVLR